MNISQHTSDLFASQREIDRLCRNYVEGRLEADELLSSVRGLAAPFA